MRAGGRQVRSCAFSPFPYVAGAVHFRASWGSFTSVRSIHPRPDGHRVRSGAFGTFLSALGVVGFARVRTVHYRAPSWWLGSFGCALHIPVRLLVRLVRSAHFREPLGSYISFGCVRSISVPSGGRLVRSGAFSPIQCALRLIGIARLRSMHFRAPWGSSG